MKRGMSWRLGALATLALLVTVVVGASAGQSALDRASQSDTLVDGTTDSITNIDPAGSYDYGTFTLQANVFEHLLDFRNGSKLEPSLATKCVSVRERDDVALHAPQGRDLPRWLGVRLDGREVLVRPGDEQEDRETGCRELAVVAPRKPEERDDEREVRRHVPPHFAPVDVALDPCDSGRPNRAVRHVRPGQPPFERASRRSGRGRTC